MDNKNNIRKGKYSSNMMLLVVLIGFCILALIEIVYGQKQIRMERERLALEEENNRAVQELKAEWNNLKGDPSVGSESVEAVGEEQNVVAEPDNILVNTGDTSSDSTAEPDEGTENPIEDDHNYDMQIVVLGDSIMADQREEHGDIPTMVGESCNARVYNMAIGGTTAALLPGDQYNFANWNSSGLLGMVNAILGNINSDYFSEPAVRNVLETCDFSQTDYFVIEYGINDFTSRQIPQSRYLENGDVLGVDGTHTYAGALETAVILLKDNFPNAQILLIAPHYCQFFEGTTFMGDAYSMNYGYGTLVDFFRCAGYVADQHKEDGVLFFNAMEESGIDAYTAEKYLEDGIHLTNLGRRMYADEVARRINADFRRAE